MSKWFPVGKNGNEEGWRLDIVSLLAVIGESSMEEHAQALTSSWTCTLPRIIPAPQALLKPTRPARLPQINSAVVGVHNGSLATTFNYFPNIMHPLEELAPLQFRVLNITHTKEKLIPATPSPIEEQKQVQASGSTSVEYDEIENGAPPLQRRRSTFRELTHAITGEVDDPKPKIPTRTFSPLNVLSVLSFLLSLGLFVLAIVIKDGTACLAVGTISLVSSIVGYASRWSPVLTKRTFRSKVPPGDIVIRTREGAFLLVKCNEDVSRELYVGSEECLYYVGTQPYRILVGIGTFLLMVSVVLLGNCTFAMQAAIGGSYIVLNGAYWIASLIPKDKFWDLSNYKVEDITPKDAENAHHKQDDSLDGKPSFTRTLWYAIRETEKIGWVKKIGAAPTTPQWDKWLDEALMNAKQNNRSWLSVRRREEVVGESDSIPQAKVANEKDTAEQHAPAFEVLPSALR